MKILPLAALCLFLAACASERIIIDRKGVDMAAYKRDLAECEAYAEEVETGRDVASEAARGAVVGSVIGAVVGNSGTAQRVGGAGAVSGASRGLRKAEQEKRQVVRNCLLGRGYRVLN